MSDDLQNAATPSSAPDSPRVRPVMGVLQRTASAISPWVRRWWTGNTPGAASGRTQGASGGFRVPGQPELALRVQRSVAVATAPDGGSALTSRFSHNIIQRHTTAEQIGRRYRPETRAVMASAPVPMPLPGVPSGGQVQRASGEMSLEDLARSFQADEGRAPQPDFGDSTVQRAYDPATPSMESGQGFSGQVGSGGVSSQPMAGGGQPTTLSDIQEAVRRAAQGRAGQPPTSEPSVQRAPERGQSTFEAIEERVRQARERQAATGQTPVEMPAPGQVAPRPADARSSPPPVQRTPESPVQRAPDAAPGAVSGSAADAGNSIAAAIRERIREARERRESGGAAPTAPQPPTGAPSIPPPVQRTPEPPIQRAPASPSQPPSQSPRPSSQPPQQRPQQRPQQPPQQPGAQVRQQSPPQVSRQPAPPTARPSTPPPIPSGQESMVGVPDDAPRELPLPPSSDASSAGFSRAEAVRQRIQRVREQGPVQPAPESRSDPASPNYSKAEAIRERIERARVQRQPVEYSTNPDDPNFSAAAQIRERIAANRAQRAAGGGQQASTGEEAAPEEMTPGMTAMPPDFEGENPAPTADVQRIAETPATPREPERSASESTQSISIAEQIRNRIQAAREQLQQGGGEVQRAPTSPSPSSLPTSPELSSAPESPPMSDLPAAVTPQGSGDTVNRSVAADAATAPSSSGASSPAQSSSPVLDAPTGPMSGPMTGPTAPTTTGPAGAPNVQRTPDDRPAIARELHLREQSLTGRDIPQAKRVRALTRSQIMTPERKTGDFTAGEPPRPGATPMLPPRVQREASEAAPKSAPTSESSSASSAPAADAGRRGDESDEGATGSVMRATDNAPPLTTESDVQRATESSAPTAETPTTTDATVSSAPERVPRTQDVTNKQGDVSSTSQSQMSEAAVTPAPEDVQRAADVIDDTSQTTHPAAQEASAPLVSDTPVADAPDSVQRAIDAQDVPTANVPPMDVSPGADASAMSTPERVQRMPEVADEADQAGASQAEVSANSRSSDASVSEPPMTDAPARVQRATDVHDAPPADLTTADVPATDVPPSPGAPTMSRPENVQRTPEVDGGLSATQTSEPRVADARAASGVERVQRSADAPEAASAPSPRDTPVKDAPERVQREVDAPGGGPDDGPSAPQTRDTMQPDVPVAPTSANIQRVPEIPAERGVTRASESPASNALGASAQPNLQRTPELPAAPNSAREVAASDRVQRARGNAERNLASGDTPDASGPSGSQHVERSTPEQVQRAADGGEAVNSLSADASAGMDAPFTSAPEGVQRTSDSPSAPNSPRMDAPSAPDAPRVEGVQRTPDVPQTLNAPGRAVTDTPEGVQRASDAPEPPRVSQAREVNAPEPRVTDAPEGVQRTPEMSEPPRAPEPRVIDTPEGVQRTPDAPEPPSAPQAREVNMPEPRVMDAPEDVQRTSDALKMPGVQGTGEARGATSPEASSSSRSEEVQRTTAASEPSGVPQTHAPRTPEVGVTETAKGVQRTSDAPEAASRSQARAVGTPERPVVGARESVQRTPEVSAPPGATDAHGVDAPGRLVVDASEGVQRSPDVSASLSATQVREVSTSDRPVTDAPEPSSAVFHPINRYRDPRMLARAVERPAAAAMSEMPIRSQRATAVLPQARVAPGLPLVEPRVQRMTEDGLRQEAMAMLTQHRAGEMATTEVQRMVDQPSAREVVPRVAPRVAPGQSGTSKAAKIQRTPLPLVKQRTSKEPEIQRKPTEESSFIGATAGTSARGQVQTENRGGIDMSMREQTRMEDEAAWQEEGDEAFEREFTPDLDRLARAIMPIVKRMLAVERDRSSVRRLL